jgi:hypothetical protein
MAWWQRITYGTTAWRISMGRRQVVESVNAALKGAFTDLGRGFVRVMGVTKMTVMLGFTLALFNLDRIRSFRAKHHLDESGEVTQRPRRPGPSGAPGPGLTSSSGPRWPHLRPTKTYFTKRK